MSANQILKSQYEIVNENPFVTFNSNGEGVSRFLDDFWDYTVQGENLKKIGFSGISKQHQVNVRRYLLALIEYNKKQDIAGHIAVTRMLYWRDAMTYLVKCWKKSDFALLASDTEWLEAKDSLDGKYSVKSLSSIAGVLNKMHEAELLDRYVEQKTLSVLAHKNPEQQHIALPTEIHAQLLVHVLDTIEKYHPYRHQISDSMARSFVFRESFRQAELNRLGLTEFTEKEEKQFRKRLNRRLDRAIPHAIPDFQLSKSGVNGEWVRQVADDCLIGVAFFSGSRRRELLSMNSGSYDDSDGIPKVKGLTSKTNEGVPVYTAWVSHPLAKQALELAYDMTEYARQCHIEVLDTAFANQSINKDTYDAGKAEANSAFITVDLRNFAEKPVNSTYLNTLRGGFDVEKFNIKATEDDVEEFNLLNPAWIGSLEVGGTLPKLNLHALRRSFAVFMVRHGLGNVLTVKYALKHKNAQMSDWYTNYAKLVQMHDKTILLDEELYNMVLEAENEMAIDVYDDIYNKSETLSGAAGERILREKEERLRKGEQIVMSREEITKLIRNNTISIVILPTGGYCTNPDCERLCSIESFVSENKRCDHEIITDKSAKIMKKQRERLIDVFRKINDFNDHAYTRILAGYKEKILVIENELKKHNIDFMHFADKINGVIL